MGINGVLIKIKRTAICGTDMHIYNWDNWAQTTIPVPMVVGTEAAPPAPLSTVRPGSNSPAPSPPSARS
jgi:hypothetical protein